MIVASAAIIFSLFTFNISTALNNLFGTQRRAASSAFITFKTMTGNQARVGHEEWSRLYPEVFAFAQVPLLGQRFYSPNPPSDAPMMHAILMAEADELGIETPPELYVRELKSFTEILMMLSRAEEPLTVEGFKRYLMMQFGLSLSAFERRLKEALRIELYRQLIDGSDNRIPDPEGVFRLYAADSEQVALQYVEFPYLKFKEQIRSAPPSDEDLVKYFEEIEEGTVILKFSHPERATFDIAWINADTADLSALPQDALAAYQEPSPDELLSAWKTDFIRYGRIDPPPASGDALPQETRDRIVRDLKVKALLTAAREQFDAELKKITSTSAPANEQSPPEDGSESPATEEPAEETAEQKAAKAEQIRAAFESTAARLGLTFHRHADVSRDQAPDLDPPKDRSLWFLQINLAETTGIQAVVPTRDRPIGYLLRLAERKPVTRKEFSEVREALLDHWVESKAGKVAEEAARAFRNQLRELVVGQSPAPLFAMLDEEKAREIKKDDDNSRLDAKAREEAKKEKEDRFFSLAASLVHPAEGQAFAKVAQENGLEVKRIEFFRRDVKKTPHFDSRFSGAQRFLMGQNGYPTEDTPYLLGAAPQFVSDLLVDKEGEAIYVALVEGRKRPEIKDMQPRDRLDAQNLWLQRDRVRRASPFFNPFSMMNLKKRHDPRVLEITVKEEQPFELPPY